MKNSAQDELDAVQLQYLQLLIDAGCKFVFRTTYFGKPYVMMKDYAGTHFLERIPDDA